MCLSCVTTMRYGVRGVFFLCNNNALWSAGRVLLVKQLSIIECGVCSSCIITMHYAVRGVFLLCDNYALWSAGCVLPVF